MSAATQSLKDKIAVITGSSAGIGAAVVLELASRGATIVINFPTDEEQEDVKKLLAKLPHQRWMAVEADLSTAEGPQQLIDRVVEVHGHIDILVNNAGRQIAKPFEQHTIEDFDSLFNLNVRGVWLTTQAVLPHLPPKAGGGGGRIVNICSAQARQPLPNRSAYLATKGAIDTLTKAWAKELPQKVNNLAYPYSFQRLTISSTVAQSTLLLQA